MNLIKLIAILMVVIVSSKKEPSQQPHSGGPDSGKASMLVVDFNYVTKGKQFKEMV